MKAKLSKGNDILLKFHSGCRKVIFDAMGIGEMKNSGIFIFGWYLGGFFIAYSIRQLRKEPGIYSMLIFFLSLVLIVLLSISGLSRGHLKNKFENRGGVK